MPTAADLQAASGAQQSVEDAAKLDTMTVGQILVTMTALPTEVSGSPTEASGSGVRVTARFDPSSASFQTILDIMKPLSAVKSVNAQQQLADLGLGDAPAVIPDTPGGTVVLAD